MFCDPVLSAMITLLSLVRTTNSSTLLEDRPSLLWWLIAELSAGSGLGTRRRLVSYFLSFCFKIMPVFWTSRASMVKLYALIPTVILPSKVDHSFV